MIIAILLFIAEASGLVSRARFAYFSEQLANVSTVSLAVSKSRGLALRAEQNLHPGQPLFAVPFTHTLSCRDVFPFAQAFPREDCRSRLMARVMYDRWVNPHPGLPADYARHQVDVDDLPCFWDDHSKRYLADAVPDAMSLSPFDYEGMKARFIATIEAFPRIREICPECVTVEAFDWAFWLVSTRIREVDNTKPKPGMRLQAVKRSYDLVYCALHPILDLANHMPFTRGSPASFKFTGEYINAAEKRVEFTADRQYRKGDEVFLRETTEGNLYLFSVFAYVVRRNPDDYVTVAFLGAAACPGLYDPATDRCTVKVGLGAVHQELLLMLRMDYMSDSVLLPDRMSPLNTTFEHYYPTLPFERMPPFKHLVTREMMLKSSLHYRKVVAERAFPQCRNSYRESVRRLKTASGTARTLKVDELCVVTWETLLGVLKPIERYLFFMMEHDLELKQDLELN